MTAPLTPPHQPQPHDPAWPPPPPPPSGPDGDPITAAEVVQGALVTVVSAVAGALLGVLWLNLAPRVLLVSDGKGVYLRNSEAETAIGSDGTFVLLALAFGAVAGLAVFLLRRRGGVPLVLGLAAGGVLGSLLARGLGTHFGPTSDVVAHAKAVGPDVPFEAPLELHLGAAALLAWPLAAMIVHLALTAAFGPRDPDPWEQPKAL
ncbi:ABC transporter permease [Streptomyces bikiniensis]|uniref:ABC transporter permease n=1 Tax=Streptomyces bikiniensis TaxID=1896 RepID=UPI0004BFCB5E|nr:ABC transporter permease [Streptomyces bikiniensis]